MSCIQYPLNPANAMQFLTPRHIGLGKFEIVENRVRLRPFLEQVIVLEKVVMPHRRMRQNQRMHRHGVLFHDVVDARVRIDHQLIGQRPRTLLVERFIAQEMLAERPVAIHARQADRGIGIQHLFGRDDLDAVGMNIKPKFTDADLLDSIVDRF